MMGDLIKEVRQLTVTLSQDPNVGAHVKTQCAKVRETIDKGWRNAHDEQGHTLPIDLPSKHSRTGQP